MRVTSCFFNTYITHFYKKNIFLIFRYIQGVSEIGALILTGNRTRQKEQLFYILKTMFNSKKKNGEIFH
jgi:hypothetical protein